MLKASSPIIFASLVISGCANLDSIYRTHVFDEREPTSKSALIDSKQREILSRNGTVCPSPQADVMTAYAIELAGKTDLSEQAQAAIAAAAQTSAAYIGVRSRNIQFSRDQIYSLCVDRMNDTVDDGQFNFYKSRLHRYQMAMSAIEQLTDPSTVQPVILSSKGESESTLASKAEKSELKKIEQEQQKIEKNGGPKADGQNLTEDEKKKIEDLKKQAQELSEKIKAAEMVEVTGQSGGTPSTVSGTNRNQLNAETVKAVTKIALATLLTDDTGLYCMERFINIENNLLDRRENLLKARPGDYRDVVIDEAQLAEIKFCENVIYRQQGSLMKLHPELLKWVTED